MKFSLGFNTSMPNIVVETAILRQGQPITIYQHISIASEVEGNLETLGPTSAATAPKLLSCGNKLRNYWWHTTLHGPSSSWANRNASMHRSGRK